MPTRQFALAYGAIFLLVGIAGFVPGMTRPSTHNVPIEHVLLLGLFPVNAMHNAVHLVFGIWGLLAYRALRSAYIYALSVAVIYAILTIMGLVPAMQTMFGLAPLFGHDVWLHAVLAMVAGYFAIAGRRGTRAAGQPTR